MAEENRPATAAARDPREEFVARIPSGSFDGLFFPPRPHRDIDAAELAFQFQLSSEASDEFRIRSARSSAQLMIEVANNEPPVSEVREKMQKRDRIPATRDPDQITVHRRKPRDDVFRQ